MAIATRRPRQPVLPPLDPGIPPVTVAGRFFFGDATSGDMTGHERLRRISAGDLRGLALHARNASYLRSAFEAAAARGGGTIDLSEARLGEDALAMLDPWMTALLRRHAACLPTADLTSSWKFVQKGLEKGRLLRPATAALLAPLLPKHANELLCLAIFQNGAETVEMLVATGINLARVTSTSARHNVWCVNSAIEGIIEGYGSTAILDTLLRAGAPAEPPRAWARGRPLVRTLQIKNPDLAIAAIDRLLAAGADLGQRASDGSTPLHVAAHEHVHPRVIEHLIDLGLDPNDAMSRQAVPLYFAITGSSEQTEHAVRVLLDRGARTDDRDASGNSILHRFAAARNSRMGLVDSILAAGATVHDRNAGGETPLHVAIASRHRALAHRLLELGADPLAVDAEGRTTLITWVKTHPYGDDDLGIGRALLAAGVPLDAPDGRGWTALAHAAHMLQDKNVDLLLALGADPGIPTNEGASIADLCGTRYPALVAEIRRKLAAASSHRAAA